MSNLLWSCKMCSKDKLCVTITGPDFSNCVRQLNSNQFVEFKTDLLQIDDLARNHLFEKADKFVVSNYDDLISIEDRVRIFKAGIENNAAYIDIGNDFYLLKHLSSALKKSNCKVIASYFNYNETPSIQELIEICVKFFGQGANLVKINCKVNSTLESITLLSLYSYFDNLICFGLGEEGRISRLFSLLCNAPFTYVSSSNIDNDRFGQYSLSQMENIIEEMQIDL